MCGEIDEQVLVGQEMLDRFRAMTKGMDLPAPDGGTGEAPVNLAEADGRAAYMERIFRSGLSRAFEDIDRAAEDEKVDALAGQAIALARLAGFLAGQLPPEADLFRALIDAISAGHAEPKERAEALRKAHDHHHGHAHDHHH
jgi:hypothetical protein